MKLLRTSFVWLITKGLTALGLCQLGLIVLSAKRLHRSVIFLLIPLVNYISGCCFFTRARIPSYLTTEVQYGQLTLAEVQLLHVYYSEP